MSHIYDSGLTDAFGKPISDSTINDIDISSFFPYSPERWRIKVNNQKVFPEYGSIEQYEHDIDIHKLKPNAGETVSFETVERTTHIVQHEISIFFIFQLNQLLQNGDVIRIGLYNEFDGWLLEKTSNHSEHEIDLTIFRDKNEIQRKTVVIDRSFLDFSCMNLRASLSNIGRQMWRQIYSDGNGNQLNQLIGLTSSDGIRGPRIGNLPLRFEITAGSNTNNLILNVGSVGFNIYGSSKTTKREKRVDFENSGINTIGTWIPLRVFRVSPNNFAVNIEIEHISLLSYSSNYKCKIVGHVFDENHITFTNTDSWKNISNISSFNSLIESRNDIDTFYDENGNIVTSSTDLIGGYEIDNSELIPENTSKYGDNFGTPRHSPLPTYVKTYGYMHVIGDGGPFIDDFDLFDFDWDLSNLDLKKFLLRRVNNPDIDLRNYISHSFGSNEPEVLISGSGITNLDGDYFVNIVDDNLVLVSKISGFSIFFSNSPTVPNYSNLPEISITSSFNLKYSQDINDNIKKILNEDRYLVIFAKVDGVNFNETINYSITFKENW